MTDEPIEPRSDASLLDPSAPGGGPSPAGASDAAADLATEWRRVGEALGRLGSGIGDSVRSAWDATAPEEATTEAPSQGLRRVADAFDRGVESARRTAGSPEARDLVNEEARRAGSQLERAMRLSIAELGRTLQRAAPDDRGGSEPATREGPGPVATRTESPATDDPVDRA